jgi:hypothetical protein
MAFASEFEFDDELELELVDFEGSKPKPKHTPTRARTRPRAPDPNKPNPNCLSPCDNPNDPSEFITPPAEPDGDLSFNARVSWFALQKDTPENDWAYHHRGVVTRIVNEIKARTKYGGCVILGVVGFADPKSESKDAQAISQSRADAFGQQILDALPDKADQKRIYSHNFQGYGTQGPVFLTMDPRIDSTAHRATNRRVWVVLNMVGCKR